MRLFLSYIAGIVFGIGIALSGMANPAKVLNFFDVAGSWDPSLAFVMGGALIVTAIGYRWAWRRTAPLAGPVFDLPSATAIDARLIGGAVVFGIGWGIAGFCPGGALPALATGRSDVLIFVAALIAGILATHWLTRRAARTIPAEQSMEETMTYPVNMDVKPDVQGFFDEATNTITYVVKDPASNACAIVDSVMDIDYAAGRITYDHADALIAHVRERGLQLEWIIETHVHADHLSAAPYLQQHLGGKIGVGAKIMVVQEVFGKVFNEGTEFQRDGSQFDKLFEDGDTYQVGSMTCFAMATPATPPPAWCMSWAMPPSWAIRSSCRTAARPGRISPAAMRERCMTASRKFWPCRKRCACSCATTTAPVDARSHGRPPWRRRKPTTSTWVAARPVRSSSASAPNAMPSWPCPT